MRPVRSRRACAKGANTTPHASLDVSHQMETFPLRPTTKWQRLRCTRAGREAPERAHADLRAELAHEKEASRTSAQALAEEVQRGEERRAYSDCTRAAIRIAITHGREAERHAPDDSGEDGGHRRGLGARLRAAHGRRRSRALRRVARGGLPRGSRGAVVSAVGSHVDRGLSMRAKGSRA